MASALDVKYGRDCTFKGHATKLAVKGRGFVVFVDEQYTVPNAERIELAGVDFCGGGKNGTEHYVEIKISDIEAEDARRLGDAAKKISPIGAHQGGHYEVSYEFLKAAPSTAQIKVTAQGGTAGQFTGNWSDALKCEDCTRTCAIDWAPDPPDAGPALPQSDAGVAEARAKLVHIHLRKDALTRDDLLTMRLPVSIRDDVDEITITPTPGSDCLCKDDQENTIATKCPAELVLGSAKGIIAEVNPLAVDEYGLRFDARGVEVLREPDVGLRILIAGGALLVLIGMVVWAMIHSRRKARKKGLENEPKPDIPPVPVPSGKLTPDDLKAIVAVLCAIERLDEQGSKRDRLLKRLPLEWTGKVPNNSANKEEYFKAILQWLDEHGGYFENGVGTRQHGVIVFMENALEEAASGGDKYRALQSTLTSLQRLYWGNS